MNKKYIRSLFIRIMISISLFLIISIVCTKSDKVLLYFKNNVYDKSFNFSGINNIYSKYFGSSLPVNTKLVFDNKLIYSSYNKYIDGAVLNDVNVVYPFKSGIVIYVGNKDDYGNVVIIEGMDEIEYWYGNLDDINVKLYDYVESGVIIGNTYMNKLYVVFKKDGNILDYEEYL